MTDGNEKNAVRSGGDVEWRAYNKDGGRIIKNGRPPRDVRPFLLSTVVDQDS